MESRVNTVIEEYFRKKVQNDPKIHNANLLVYSEKHNLHLHLAEGSTGEISAHAQQPYYIASVSKLFTSVLIAMLVEKSMCSFDDYISTYLDNDLLHKLHVYKGVDFTSEIKIKHLLNHTSGLYDFMEDKPKKGITIVDSIVNEPSRSWTPRDVLNWAKQHLEPLSPPEKKFHYSDTGYHLLGLTIESIMNKPLDEVFHEYIFEPLEMKHSFLHGSESIEKSDHPVADLYIQNINIIDYQSLSVVYAGGGIVSTNEDLLKFMKALVNYKIIRKETLLKMKADYGRFFLGIDYGYGLMNIKTIPILMPAKFNAWGNAGSTGSFMFYHPGSDAYLIGSFNHFGYGQKGIRFMLQLINKIQKNTND
ncbi:serine hydrolase domain-containing protein [Aquibacillus albus]|uniref:D-alanyl-D-alanine carboxypeptidase n=1 Tax=Aquibacillus albus TaxID=1168171 RepID=A0ABS2N1B0_9BACI|nr:serine hydrolase domain-containing protein [Aquibacillus albus]MBM7571925.1 D-alanyl-D-alanine carboxypeptidase [Aquibacillus albus]